MNDDLMVITKINLDNSSLEFIQNLEKNLDEALAPLGFTRVGSGKGGVTTTFIYRQFGKAL